MSNDDEEMTFAAPVEVETPTPKVVIAAIFDRPNDVREIAKIAQIVKWAFQDREHVQIVAAKDDAAEMFMHILQSPEDLDSNLVRHAKRELELLGEEQATVDGYLRMIKIFALMGHSGGSASVFIPTLNALLQFKNLTQLTDDPDEWMEVGTGVWQSVRCSSCFSEDGGKTYHDINEPGYSEDDDSEPRRYIHNTMHKDS